MGRGRTVALIAAAAAPVVVSASRQVRAVRRVPPAYRSPQLYLPLSLRTRAGLRLGRRRMTAASTAPDSVTVHRRTASAAGAEDVAVFVYDPDGRRRPAAALLWLHGGGLVMGTAARDHDTAGRIAAELGIVVVNVDYRLAPEHPYPAAIDDCATALSWLHEGADELGVDRGRIAVGGASAGAGLAAALAQRATDAGVPVAFQLLKYPMLDDRTTLVRQRGARGRLIWTTASNRVGWTAYLGRRPAAERDGGAYAVPARRVDLAGLPPAWIGVGDLDLFHDEDVAYARRLREVGVDVDLLVVPGMYHGADGVAVSDPAMIAFRRSMLDALATALGVATTASL